MKEWAQIGLDTGIPWPTAEVTVPFSGRQIILTPGTEDLLTTVSIQTTEGESTEEARAVLNRFLSSLSWVWKAHARRVISGGGGHRIRLGRSLYRGITISPEHFRCDYLPEPSSKDQRLALALYREALGVNSVAYKFLGFFKVLNIKVSGARLIAWVNAHLADLRDAQALKRIDEIQASSSDVGKYLYVSGRCAVAHASANPIVDPDDPADMLRLENDLPVAKALAELFIEKELGIKTMSTVFNEHLYELEGFRELLGADLVSRLKRREVVVSDEIQPIPALAIAVDGKGSYDAFDFLEVFQVGVKDGVLNLVCRSREKLLVTQIVLDFPEERLYFDPYGFTHIVDDGTPQVFVYARGRLAFLRDLLLNGIVLVKDAASGKCLSRCDPFVAEIIDLEGTLANITREIEGYARLEALRCSGAQGSTSLA